METKFFETIYGTIECVPRYDVDNGNTFYEMYDKDGGYYGALYTDNIDGLDDMDVEDTIADNINY